jgi:hypothetical protein
MISEETPGMLAVLVREKNADAILLGYVSTAVVVSPDD